MYKYEVQCDYRWHSLPLGNRDEDGAWIVECPSIPGCVSQGETKKEGLTNIQDAIAACLEVRADRGMPLKKDLRIKIS